MPVNIFQPFLFDLPPCRGRRSHSPACWSSHGLEASASCRAHSRSSRGWFRICSPHSSRECFPHSREYLRSTQGVSAYSHQHSSLRDQRGSLEYYPVDLGSSRCWTASPLQHQVPPPTLYLSSKCLWGPAACAACGR